MFNGPVRQQKHFEVTYWWGGGWTEFTSVGPGWVDRGDNGGMGPGWVMHHGAVRCQKLSDSHMFQCQQSCRKILCRNSSEMHF